MEQAADRRAWDKLNKSSLTHQEVLNISQVTNSTLQTWIARGFLELKEKSPGTGKKRGYTPLEAVRIVLLNNLVLQGVSISHAAYIVKDSSTEQQILLNAEHFVPETRLARERERKRYRFNRERPDSRRDVLVFRRRPEIVGVTMIGSPGMIRPYEAVGLNYEDFTRGRFLPPFGMNEQDVREVFQGPGVVVPIRNVVQTVLGTILKPEPGEIQ